MLIRDNPKEEGGPKSVSARQAPPGRAPRGWREGQQGDLCEPTMIMRQTPPQARTL